MSSGNHNYQLFDKEAKNSEKTASLINCAGKTEYTHAYNMIPIFVILPKIKLQIDQRPQGEI